MARGLRSFGFRFLIGCLLTSSAPAQESPSVARIWNEQALSAIRLTVPDPPRHARNLFHLAAAMWNAWAAFDPGAVGYLHHEKLEMPKEQIEAARRMAIHYAAYRLLRARHLEDPEDTGILAALDARLVAVGGSPAVAQSAITESATPEELGKRCAQAVLDWGACREYPPFPTFVSFGERRFGDRFAEAKMIERFQAGVGAGCDVAQAITRGQLGENQGDELLTESEMAVSRPGFVFGNQSRERLPVNQIQNLREDVTASIHVPKSSPNGQRSSNPSHPSLFLSRSLPIFSKIYFFV